MRPEGPGFRFRVWELRDVFAQALALQKEGIGFRASVTLCSVLASSVICCNGTVPQLYAVAVELYRPSTKSNPVATMKKSNQKQCAITITIHHGTWNVGLSPAMSHPLQSGQRPSLLHQSNQHLGLGIIGSRLRRRDDRLEPSFSRP